MTFRSLFLVLFFSFSTLFASFPPELKTKILFLMHRGESEKALVSYLNYASESGTQDFELLQKASFALLMQGIKSDDAEIKLLSLYGAGISLNKEALPLLACGVNSDDLRMQMVALSFLEKYHDDEALEIVKKSLSSTNVLPRLQAAYTLAKAGDEEVADQLASLYEKVNEKIRPLFAEILGQCEGESATLMLKRLLNDPIAEVRLAAICEVGEGEKEELLEKIRSIANQGNFREEECAAFVLGKLKDSSSRERLWNLTKKKSETTRLSAYKALLEIGENGIYEKIREENSPFALALLSTDCESRTFLRKALESDDFAYRVNAAKALLELGELPPLNLIKTMLISDLRDLGFLNERSPGTTLSYFKPIANKSDQEKRFPRLNRDTLQFKDQILKALFKFPEADFLKVAKAVLESQETCLYLPTMALLLEKESERSKELVKEMAEKAGAPFARITAKLALFEMTNDPLLEKELIAWLKNTYEQPMIRFKKDELPTQLKSSYQLTPEETSEILIVTFETLARTRQAASIEALLSAMAYGNSKNRYALAGLLIKATE